MATGLDRYHPLGRTGLKVSRLALGTMTFGTDWGWGADRETAQAMFDAYVEAGGNFFDTADMYTGGESERMLGGLIRERGLRDRAVVAGKFGYNADATNPNAGGNGRKAMVRAVEGSLARLGTDHLDLYLVHTWDRLTPADEVMRAFDDLVAAGKVLHVGLSDVPAWYAARAQTLAEWRGWTPLAALQLEYSLVERFIEHEFTPLGAELGMGVMVWGPLASGLLSGKYRPGEAGAGRLDLVADSGNPAFAKFTERNWRIVAELERVAAALGRPMAQVAVNWVANRPGVASVILGATGPGQLAETLNALSFELPAELEAELDAVSAPARPFPYSFFGDEIQSVVHGGLAVGARPPRYLAS